MKLERLFKSLVLFLGLGSAVFLHASSIAVYPLMSDLNYSKRFQDIEVTNTGNDVAYVTVDVARIDHPGEPNQTLVPLRDNPFQIGLIVTPTKMVIPVGQTRMLRALYVGKPSSADVVYRIKVAPVTGQLVALTQGKRNIDAGIQMIIAYGVTIFVRPEVLQPKIEAIRTGTQLLLTNTGNTSVLVTHCQQCTGGIDKGNNCKVVDTLITRLYPGNQKQFVLPRDLPLNCLEEVYQQKFIPFNIS